MRVGVHLYRFDSVEPTALRQELADAARAAEDAGVAWVSVMDHYFQMVAAGFPADDPMLEAYTTLGYLAGVTSEVQLGVLVTGVTYRHPGLLAKIHATLDVLSGGRATLGIGAAWYEEEHRAMGVPYPPLSERFERLEETLQICRQMWDPTNDGPYDGQALPAGADPVLAAAADPARDPRRRLRRAQDPAPRRAVRRRVQPVHVHARRGRAQARGPARPLRGPRPRPRRDPRDHAVPRRAAARRGRRRVRRGDARLRRPRRGDGDPHPGGHQPVGVGEGRRRPRGPAPGGAGQA